LINLILLFLSFLASPGWASHYAPGVMQSPAAYHNIDYNHGYVVAVASCDLIGQPVLLTLDGEQWEKHTVVDCAGDDGTPAWMARNNIIVEVSHETCKRWNSCGGGVRVMCLGCLD